jgi:hypothetical protein
VTEEILIDYSYISLEEYKTLSDGSPNLHYIPALTISNNCGTPILEFLEMLSYNTNLDGHSVTKINFKIHSNEITEPTDTP